MSKKSNVNKVVSFLTSNGKTLDTTKTSALARKIDSKDKSENAPRFLAINTKRTNALNEFVEKTKTALFANVKVTYGVSIGKDFLAEVLAETNLLLDLDCIKKAKKALMKRFEVETLSDDDFHAALQTAFKNHNTIVSPVMVKALENLGTKAKVIFNGKEKENFIALVTKAKTPETKTPRKAKAKAAGASASV